MPSSQPCPRRFHSVRRLFVRRIYQDVFVISSTPTTSSLEAARDSFTQTSTACHDALQLIISKCPDTPELKELKRQTDELHNYMPILAILGLSTDTYVDDIIRQLLLSIIYLLSATLVNHLSLLHPTWLSLGKKSVQFNNEWIQESTNSLHGAVSDLENIPSKYTNGRTPALIRLGENTAIRKVIERGRFRELIRLMSRLNELQSWDQLSWNKRQEVHLMGGIRHLTLLSKGAIDICKRREWEGLMLPLPLEFDIRKHQIESAEEQANYHLTCIKPQVMKDISKQIGHYSADFTLCQSRMPLQGSLENKGLWLIKSSSYHSWYNSVAGSTKRFLWYLGGIGMGKSILMDAVSYRHERDSAILPVTSRPIFVSIHIHHREVFTFREILQAILQQIVTQAKMPTDLMVKMTSDTHTPKNLPVDVLYLMLRELTQSYKIYFFLDGLDESDPQIIKEVVDRLVSLGENHRIICFSRPTSVLCAESFPSFTFQTIEPDISDMQGYLNFTLPALERSNGRRFSSTEVSEIVAQAKANSQGGFLLFATQIKAALSVRSRRPLEEVMKEIPEPAILRYDSTLRRISNRSPVGKDICTIIAWLGVMGNLSVSEDIPYIVPKLAASSPEYISRLVADSLGFVKIAKEEIALSGYIAEACVTERFSSFFPSFFDDVQAGISSLPLEPNLERLAKSFDRFITTRPDIPQTARNRKFRSASGVVEAPESPNDMKVLLALE